jgi:polysaccharide pyruvyl transferase WcaK-like protein
MDAVLVGDHRETMNWGGRGQTIALHDLLATKFRITDAIKSSVLLSVEAGEAYVGGALPIALVNYLARKRGRFKLIDACLGLNQKLGQTDCITHNPEESLRLLLKYKDNSKGLQAVFDAVNEADVVVINGEGAGVLATPYRRDFHFYLTMAELGKHLQKKVFYVNGIISDCPLTGRNEKSLHAAKNSLSKCDRVLWRDPQSLEFARREMPHVRSDYIPDALFIWYERQEEIRNSLVKNGDFIVPHPDAYEHFGKLDFSVPYICVGGSSFAATNQENAADCYTELCAVLKQMGLRVYLTQNCGGDRFLHEVARRLELGIVPAKTPIYSCGAVLANARLFISGRFHATILAALAGTPCVFLGAHSHKMHSLQRILEYENPLMFSGLPSGEEVHRILTAAKELLEDEERLRTKICQVSAKLCAHAKTLPSVMEACIQQGSERVLTI